MGRGSLDTPSDRAAGRTRRRHSLWSRVTFDWSDWHARPLWYRFVGVGACVVGIAVAAEVLGFALTLGGNANGALVLACAVGIAVVGGCYTGFGLVLGRRVARATLHRRLAAAGRDRRHRP